MEAVEFISRFAPYIVSLSYGGVGRIMKALCAGHMYGKRNKQTELANLPMIVNDMKPEEKVLYEIMLDCLDGDF